MFGQRCGHPANVLLPFHVNGTLSEQEEGEVGAHVQECATCRAEVETLEGIADAIRSAPPSGEEVVRSGWPAGARAALALAATFAVALPAVVVWRAANRAPAVLADAIPDRGPAVGSMRSAVYLDLKGGPTRGAAADLPRLGEGPDQDLVVLALTLPRRPEATDRLELADPSGRVVATGDSPVMVDVYGRTTLVVQRSVLAAHGRYVLALRGAAGSATPDVAPSYSFQVGPD